MARSSQTWEKGKKPPVSRPKGRKNNKTLMREKLGISGWADVNRWIEGPGIKAVFAEISKLKGKEKVDAMAKMMEYFKPKLTRTEHTGAMQVNNYNVDLSKEDMKNINQTLEDEC